MVRNSEPLEGNKLSNLGKRKDRSFQDPKCLGLFLGTIHSYSSAAHDMCVKSLIESRLK